MLTMFAQAHMVPLHIKKLLVCLITLSYQLVVLWVRTAWAMMLTVLGEEAFVDLAITAMAMFAYRLACA